jgi:hypothetical protein
MAMAIQKSNNLQKPSIYLTYSFKFHSVILRRIESIDNQICFLRRIAKFKLWNSSVTSPVTHREDAQRPRFFYIRHRSAACHCNLIQHGELIPAADDDDPDGLGPQASSPPLHHRPCSGSGGVSVPSVVTEAFFNRIKSQAGDGCEGKNLYTRGAFLSTAGSFPGFARGGSEEDDGKCELASRHLLCARHVRDQTTDVNSPIKPYPASFS